MATTKSEEPKHLDLAPPPVRRSTRALLIAAGAHVFLVAALTWGVHWTRSAPEVSFDAEIWSAMPVEAAPKTVSAPPKPEPPQIEPVKPEPEPKPERVSAPPPPPPPAAPKVQAAPEPPKVDIALEQEKLRLQKEKEAEIARQEELKKERLRQEKLKEEERKRELERQRIEKEKREKERLEKERQEKLRLEKLEREKKLAAEKAAAKKAAEERAAAKKAAEEKAAAEKLERVAEQARTEQMQRMAGMAGMAGASGQANAKGTAAKSSGPSASYAGRIRARVKPNIVYVEEIAGNPAAEVTVLTSPDGTIVGRTLVRSSGVASWDEAVLKAIDKTQVLPRDVDGTVPSSLTLIFRPKD